MKTYTTKANTILLRYEHIPYILPGIRTTVLPISGVIGTTVVWIASVLKNRDVQWFILHRQVSVMLFKATVGVVERFCMIMLFGVLPLYVLCHVLTCIGQETINYLILSIFQKHFFFSINHC